MDVLLFVFYRIAGTKACYPFVLPESCCITRIEVALCCRNALYCIVYSIEYNFYRSTVCSHAYYQPPCVIEFVGPDCFARPDYRRPWQWPNDTGRSQTIRNQRRWFFRRCKFVYRNVQFSIHPGEGIGPLGVEFYSQFVVQFDV